MISIKDIYIYIYIYYHKAHCHKNNHENLSLLGIRISRKLPYEFQISDKAKENIVNIQIVNTGESGAPFVLFDVINLSTAMPLKYAVEAAKEINYDLKIVEASGDYSFHLQGK